ncbi:hypothetical protein [Longispora albida]|uniref:hypothetical protein n=1 Tax=Longispora albida TaxID=203523 RepID=UPI00036A9815|nr:hypothetical protein [Longispora albida]
MDSVLLFSKGDLSSGLEATFRHMIKLLQDRNPDALLSTPEADTIAELIDKGSVRCPVLHRDEWWMDEPAETTFQHSEFGRQVQRRVPRLTVIVPFDGEHEVFMIRARTYGFNPPRIAAVNKADLRLTWEAPATDAAAIRAHFEQEIDKIEEYLSWSRAQIDEHNQRVVNEVPGLVARRRQELLNVRNIQADIGIPVRRRGDAATYSVPVTRRTLQVARQPARPKAGLFKPEPALSEPQYEDALEVLRNARNGLERSPTTTAKLSEEEIRNILLIALNSVFQGNAAGEVFNGAGKTDILVRIEDRNVFIGECKIWKGPKTIEEALEQLFGYLVWRDTKAALLLFIRHANVTAIIDKAVAKIEEHPNFKRRGRHGTEDRHDFVMHAVGDPNREIHLALLPFALRPTTAPPPTSP